MNMKVRSIWFSGCIFLSTTLTFGKEYKLWYNAPATVWEEALPIGNGRIGAMVYGNPLQEVYQLNEESIWSGFPPRQLVEHQVCHRQVTGCIRTLCIGFQSSLALA